MINKIKLENIDAVILCGGKGKRLQPLVNDRPKPLAEIDNYPFLDILTNYVASFGIRRLILCTGYMGNLIKQYYGAPRANFRGSPDFSRDCAPSGRHPDRRRDEKKDTGLTFIFSAEKRPLGTAGAIKNAESLIKSNPFLVMNGDSFCQIDLNKFLNFHTKKRALFSIALSNIQNTNDCGKVVLDKHGRVSRFNEKKKSRPTDNFTNVGIYLLDRTILSEIPENKKRSFEYEIFPRIVNKKFYGFITQERLIDIGTPERFKQAKTELANANRY